MSRNKRNQKAIMAATGAGRRVAAQVKPLAQSTGAAATRRVRETRAWAAPRVERTGLVLQHSVAPKVSAWLSSAARRLEPAKPQRARWRKLAGISMLTAAAGAAAAFARNRMKKDSTAPVAETGPGDAAPAAATDDGQAMASADADLDGQVRTS